MYKFACSECTVHVQDDYLSILIAAAGFLDLVALSEEVCSLYWATSSMAVTVSFNFLLTSYQMLSYYVLTIASINRLTRYLWLPVSHSLLTG